MARLRSSSATVTTRTDDSPVLTSPIFNTGISGSAILDEDNLAGDSDTKLATQQSIKAYVDGVGVQTGADAQAVGSGDSPTFAGATLTGAITTNSTFDGRDVAADGTKLDGIEASATADQTAAQLLTAIKTVDGSGSGLDADLLDGAQGSSYLLKSGGAMTGNISFPAGQNIIRTTHSSGFLEGSYNNVGGNESKTNPIYTIGSSYNPTDTALSNMYGIGYSHTNLTGMIGGGWGMYVAADGDVRIGLSGSTGEIRATGNITAYYSDERLKDFDGKIDNALDKVMKLNGYYFTENAKAKELGYSNDRRQVGVSAQEVEAVLPEVVTEAPMPVNDEDYKTVWYDKLVPLLIEAIKEQQTQINELKSLIKKGI